MPKDKPKYRGNILTGGKIKIHNREKLHNALRNFYPNQQSSDDTSWENPADVFAAQLLDDAGWAASMIFHMQSDITTGETKAEYSDLLVSLNRTVKTLHQSESKLRNISQDLDRLFDMSSDPLGCADHLFKTAKLTQELIQHVENATPRINKLPRAMKPDQKKHGIALEMSIRILRKLDSYGIETSPYKSSNSQGSYPVSITILKTIGDQVGLAMAPTTWKDIIIEAKPSINNE